MTVACAEIGLSVHPALNTTLCSGAQQPQHPEHRYPGQESGLKPYGQTALIQHEG